MSKSGKGVPFVLGIDLGVSSLGWSCIDLQDKKPCAIRASGVRIFEAGVEGDVEQGKDSSRAAIRRDKRQPRRQFERRARRQRKIFRILQTEGLLPEGPSTDQSKIDMILAQLDRSLREQLVQPHDRIAAHVWPYRLRAMALDQRLAPHALGRAIYHLAQRRGFLSNRKTDTEDEHSKLKDGDPARNMTGMNATLVFWQSVSARTLGEAMSKLDPETLRIRQRYTHRDWYKDEFDAIWAAQARHHPNLLTDRLKHRLCQAIFRQRPLKSAKGLVGRCELEPTKRRTLRASPWAQRFRMLAAVNNLVVVDPRGARRGLTKDERDKLIRVLERQGDQTFNQIRKLLGLKGNSARKDNATGEKVVVPGYGFNLEEGGEKKLPGDRTATKLYEIFGERWFGFSDRQQEQIVHDLTEYQNPKALAERFHVQWNLDNEMASKLAQIRLEQDYARFSRRALQRLVARMEEGLPYMTARKDEYPASFETEPALDHLPPFEDMLLASRRADFFAALADIPKQRAEKARITLERKAQGLAAGPKRRVPAVLRNPAVCRALTELRKVVNAVIRKYGKPTMIRLEMARELKQPRKQREQTWKRNRDRQDEREVTASKIKAAKLVVGEPNRDAVEKWLLADECNWMCPYTGKVITPESLLGPYPQFDVEHIMPFSISLDNTFINKTLCDTHFNRHHKVNRLPTQCYELESQAWHEVLQRVRRFQGNAAAVKLERFQWTEVPDGFTNRHLQDTRYAARLASDYLSLLYGGTVDEHDERKVQVSSGGVTAFLRNEWGMNGILNDGGIKTRDDHRHHAVDAITIAMTSPATVKMLSDSAEKAAAVGRKRFEQVAEPWHGFLDEVRESITNTMVSHRQDRKIAGPLHAETNYSRPIHALDGSRTVRKRIPITSLTAAMIKENAIADVPVRNAIRTRWKELGGGDPKKVFVAATNHPFLTSRDGRHIPIHRVRINVNDKPRPISSGAKRRHIVSGKDSLHHTVIVAEQTKSGERWRDEPVDRFEIHRRHAAHPAIPLIQTDWGEDSFVMALAKGDCIEMDNGSDGRNIFVIRSISKSDITIRLHNDARTDKKIGEAKQRSQFRIRSADELRKRHACRVVLDPMGGIHRVRIGHE